MKIEKELLYRFFNQETSADEEKQIRQWMEESDENSHDFFQERNMYNALLLLNETQNTRKKRFFGMPWRKIIYASIGVAAIVFLTFKLSTNYLKQSLQNNIMCKINVPQGQRVNLTLADGTEVWLNAKTAMEYPQSFNLSETREVKIDGEAYFHVSKDREHPFIVKTGKGSVLVRGTEFYIKAYSQTNNFETSLLEGSVLVQTANEKMILKPNDKVILKNGHLICEKIDDMDVFRWKEGLLCFRELSFTNVLKQLELYYDVNFIVDKNLNKNPLMTGKFRMVDGVEYALEVLQKEIPFQFTRKENSKTIYIE